ncbi:xanthine dehydrogenase family protein molybdopterin-binding subunit [Hahella aquimaris]|uniref:xanthine dehydrogenase family protein molybdopterin-binding subunit n=1 Tax=Hahella sp. HNIBRBA332 TaxID=3015983 RepID=UPI00273B2390|nr:xanthine dehydrogenase family protein molybdopterin-binding subunit [Hahella sp. HNIBRBA332]WLQ14838.1 xanthine dehydrogenase family protein molybdopterin-binding subunit [Hahella sp. HNIBRBA332]
METIALSRRDLLRASLSAGGGLIVALQLPGCASLPQGMEANSLRPNAWLEVTPDNRVILTLDRVEMGQGTYTGMCTLLAEELDVDPAAIEVVFAPVDSAYEQPDFGLQITGGSTSLSSNWVRLREAGAMGRAMLVAAAAQVWNAPASSIITEHGACRLREGGPSLSYGELAELAARQPAPTNITLKSPEDYRYIGKFNQRLDASLKSFGQADFGIDVQLPDMLYAVMARPPAAGGSVRALDDREARNMPGVAAVIQVPRGVAVVADKYWRARQARDKLKIEWDAGELGALDTASVFDLYRQTLATQSGDTVRSEGDVERALASTSARVTGEYRAPFLAHATMEPQNCTVWFRDGRCDVWAPTQGPDVARAVARRECGLSAADIHIRTTFIGGGFGRRLSQDFVGEAVSIAQHFDRPVKLIWSREEDIQHDLFRPASLHRLTAALSPGGEALAWTHDIAAPRVIDHYVREAAGAVAPTWAPQAMVRMAAGVAKMVTPDQSAYEGAEDIPYAIPHIRVRHMKADAGVPISYWRSVGHSFNAFVVESFIDELAHHARQDPVAYREGLLRDHPRHLRVLRAAAQKAGWNGPLASGRAHGVACHKSFGTYVAQIAEVSVESDAIRVHRVVCAVDCGLAVNPDTVIAQMQGGVIFGLTAALYGEITHTQGAVRQSNFHDYPVLRMNETPIIDVVLVGGDAAPTGVGEPGTPPIAPAVANAVFRLTGRRLRDLPLRLKT